jgi:hypothetical protein
MLFDFEPSKNRDLTETVQILAGMSRFVIADITDAKSVGHELSHIVPTLASVAVQPILLAGESGYAMFEHWRRYAWVLPEMHYGSAEQLTEELLPKIIGQVESFERGTSEVDRLRARVKELGG